MFGVENTPFLVIISLLIGYFWGKYRINSDASSLYRTRRLSKAQEKTLINGLKEARAYIQTN